MAQTLWSDISSLANNIQEGALFTLRSQNKLVATVTTFGNSNGHNPRVGYDWSALTVATLGEGDDIVAQNFAKTSRVTLTPARYGAQVFLTDIRIRSDWDQVRSASVMELGAEHANDADTNIAGNFASLTGGTIGASGTTITWSHITQAKATLKQANVPEPYYCVLGEGMWYHLLHDVIVDGSTFQNTDAVSQEFAQHYYVSKLLGGVIFATTGNLSGNATSNAFGAMYSPMAIAYDERQGFSIEPERDASRKGWEFNSNIEYAHGVWAAARGVAIEGTDVIG